MIGESERLGIEMEGIEEWVVGELPDSASFLAGMALGDSPRVASAPEVGGRSKVGYCDVAVRGTIEFSLPVCCTSETGAMTISEAFGESFREGEDVKGGVLSSAGEASRCFFSRCGFSSIVSIFACDSSMNGFAVSELGLSSNGLAEGGT